MQEQLSQNDIAALTYGLENDPLVFARHFFPTFFSLPFSPCHRILVRSLLKSQKLWNLAFIARGGGKSIIVSCLLALWYAVRLKYGYIVLFSQGQDKANQLLDDIKAAIKSPQFVNMFGDIIGAKDSVKRVHLYSEEWGINCMIESKSLYAKTRGARIGKDRIDLAIIDDAEDDEDVANPKRVDNTESIVNKKILPALSTERGQIFWMATTIAADCAAVRATEYNDCMVIRFPAIIDTEKMSLQTGIKMGHSFWPEKFSDEFLFQKRDDFMSRSMGAVWWAEYMLDPKKAGTLVFRDEMALTAKRTPGFLRGIPLYMTMDSAYAQKRSACYTAISVGGYNSEGQLVVAEAKKGKYAPNDLINEVVSILSKYADKETFDNPIIQAGIESTSYDMLNYVLDAAIVASGSRTQVKQLSHKNRHKHDRIRAMIPLQESGKLILCDDLTDLSQEMHRFPNSRDGVDSLDATAYLLDMCHVPSKPKESEKVFPENSVARALQQRRIQEVQRAMRSREARYWHTGRAQ